jgi:4-amino-4-deoxy-L-arabinose transferase-like glycosyltransferase
MPSRRAVLLLAALTAALAALHLWMAAILELAPDEAYYWTWSRDLSLSYPDHPPLVAWLIRLGTAVAGRSELGVRLPFVLLGSALIPLAYALGRRLALRPGFALLAAAAVGTSLLGSAGALLATPETPLVFGWTLGLLGLAGLAANASPRPDALLLAAGTAVALLSKLTGLLLPLVAVLWLATAAGRPWRRRPAFWLALAGGAFLASPAWLADLLSSRSAAAFQLGHGLWTSDLGLLPRLGNLAAYLGAQVGLLSPLLAVAALLFLVRRPVAPAPGLLRLSALVPWSLFAFAALLAPPEPNWPACAHVGALLGAALLAQEARARGARWARPAWLALALGVQLVTSAAVHVHLLRPFLPLETAEPEPFAGPSDPAARLHGWRALAEALSREDGPVLAGSYAVGPELRFYAPAVTSPQTATTGGEKGTDPWWIEPREGASLPGRRASAVPPTCCTPVPLDPRTVAPALLRPAAPVRLRRLHCPPGCLR